MFKRDSPPVLRLTHVSDADLRVLFTTCYAWVGYVLDPFRTTAFGGAVDTARQLREISPDRFVTSEYFARCYAATNLVDELGGAIRTNPKTALHLSLGRKYVRVRLARGDRIRLTGSGGGSWGMVWMMDR